LERIERIFSDKEGSIKGKEREFVDHLYKQIGKKAIEIKWLKKGGVAGFYNGGQEELST